MIAPHKNYEWVEANKQLPAEWIFKGSKQLRYLGGHANYLITGAIYSGSLFKLGDKYVLDANGRYIYDSKAEFNKYWERMRIG